MSTTLSDIDQKTFAAETRSNLLAPKLRFKEFDGEWKRKILGDVSIFLDGKRKPIKSEDRAKMKGEFPYYGASGIIDYVNNYLFDEDIILLGEDGENIISRNLPLAFRVSGKCWVNNHAHVIKPKADTNIDFLTHNLERINYVIYNTGTAQPKLNQEVCRNIPSYFPTLPEQQKIASFLSAVDEKIQQLTRKKELLEQYKKGVMQHLFSGKLRFKPAQSEVEGDENGKDFPDWEEKMLGDVGDFKNGLNKDKNDFGFGSPFVNLMNVFGKRELNNQPFDLVNSNNSEKELYSMQKGDVLFIRSSVKRSGVGEAVVVNEDLPQTVYSGFLIRFRDDRKTLDQKFKKYCFANYSFRKELLSYATTSANTNINQESLGFVKLRVPVIAEQQKIATYLSAIDTKIETVAKQITQTQRFKKGLLQQMFV